MKIVRLYFIFHYRNSLYQHLYNKCLCYQCLISFIQGKVVFTLATCIRTDIPLFHPLGTWHSFLYIAPGRIWPIPTLLYLRIVFLCYEICTAATVYCPCILTVIFLSHLPYSSFLSLGILTEIPQGFIVALGSTSDQCSHSSTISPTSIASAWSITWKCCNLTH